MKFIENNKFQLENELKDGIKNAKEVFIAVAYLRKSGCQLLKGEIVDLIKRGGRIKIIAGTDFGYTEAEALDELRKIGAQVKIYVDDQVLFHPKCYIFTNANFTKAIVGSSNLSANGLNSGVEWNALIDNSDILCNTIRNTFNQLWNSANTKDISDKELDKIKKNNNKFIKRYGKIIKKLDLIKKVEKLITFKFEVNESFRKYSNHPVTIPAEFNSLLDEYKINKHFPIKIIFKNNNLIDGYMQHSYHGKDISYPYYQIRTRGSIDKSIIKEFKLGELIKIEMQLKFDLIVIRFIKS